MTNLQMPTKRKNRRNSKYAHQWVTVVNPSNHRTLLQACDKCGVVKSENSVTRRCAKPHGQHLITDSLASTLRSTA